ncbi:hypothetical protein [Alteribacter lacisalsi]|nr:hypothetical protein [Alteribacter lacisalsi]
MRGVWKRDPYWEAAEADWTIDGLGELSDVCKEWLQQSEESD